MNNNTALIPGSLGAIAKQENQSLAESFLAADAIVLIDVSGSMGARDILHRHRHSQTRYEIACDELKKLQASLPGKVAVVSFSSETRFCPSGIPPFDGCGTDLAAALKFVHVADDCGITFIVISDGEPNDQRLALAEAKRFKSKISTVFIGPEGEAGAKFLKQLADTSGGQHQANSVAQLADTCQQLLLAAG